MPGHLAAHFTGLATLPDWPGHGGIRSIGLEFGCLLDHQAEWPRSQTGATSSHGAMWALPDPQKRARIADGATPFPQERRYG